MQVIRNTPWIFALCALSACSPHDENIDSGAMDAGTKTDGATDNVACDTGDSSFQGIQRVVFDGYGCTNSACHGQPGGTGGLDLRESVAYDSLFRVQSTASLKEPMQRVFAGDQNVSFLYRKLAAATEGTKLPEGAGAPMPVGLAPLSANHLEAVRLWIRGGAPEEGNVAGVNELLDCGQSTMVIANKIKPPAPPVLGKGAQFVSGPWNVSAGTEDEVCFATYYDLSQTEGLLPEWAKTPCGDRIGEFASECFAVSERALTQDPQSHHSIINAYIGPEGPDDAVWGKWTCHNGPHEGMECDPQRIGVSVLDGGADCEGTLSVCASEVAHGAGCPGWGPGGRNQRQVSMGGAQAPTSSSNYAEGVYAVLPSKAVIIWNSHGFNLTGQDTTIEQYNNVWFAPEDERLHLARRIFDFKDIFVANVPPYEQRTYCSTYTLPQGARLTGLSSHAHKRGVLWQTWLPPNDPSCTVDSKCEPSDSEPEYVSRTYNDPLSLTYDSPLAFDAEDESERTLKFCVTYDNGMENPDLLKRNSTSIGSTCDGAAYCVGGDSPGLECGSDDSLCGDGGLCDACPVVGGQTTEDEMFLMLGSYYVLNAR